MGERRTFFQFVIPSVLAFALSGIYAVVDGFFIGNSLGDTGLAAINLAYPVSALIQAAGTGIGLSGAIRFTIMRGQKKFGKDRECLGCTLLLLILAGIVLTALLLPGLPLFLRVFRAEGPMALLVTDYVRVIAAGALFQLFATGLVPFVRNLGGALFAMATMTAGFATNIILDYLLVWVLGRGMAGAAWATLAGQAVTMALTVFYLMRKGIGLSFPSRHRMRSMGRILKVAAAPFGLTISPQITMVFMNRSLMRYGGEQSVAVYGCVAYITAIIYLLLQGVGDGSQPLFSRYFSEGDLPALRRVRRSAYLMSGGTALFCAAAIFLSRGWIGSLFGASPEAGGAVARCLPLFLSTLLLLAYVRITTAFFYATEKSGLSYLLVYSEPVLLFLLLLFLPGILGLRGVWAAVPLAQGLTWGISVGIKRKADRQAVVSEKR